MVYIVYDLDIIEQRIMLIATKMKLSKNKLLSNASLNKSVFDNMKKGTIPSVDKIHRIADYLDVSVDFILGRTETTKVVNVPDKIIDIVSAQYNKNPKKFISDEFIKAPVKTMKKQEYSFYDCYYDDYINIFDEAYEYANENGIDMLKSTGIGSKKDYLEMINIHDDFVPKMITGKYYSLTQDNYNIFLEVYKLYCKAYAEYVKNLLRK